MAEASTEPLLAIYVVWHPDFSPGEAIAGALHDHYRRNLFVNVAGGSGLSVINRSAPPPGSTVPLPINLDDAATTAVVALLDEKAVKDPAWPPYLQDIAQRTDAARLRARLYPVAMDATAFGIGGAVGGINFIRWESWFGDPIEDRPRKLVLQLTYQF